MRFLATLGVGNVIVTSVLISFSGEDVPNRAQRRLPEPLPCCVLNLERMR